ncbi:MAG: D-aminoacyl-tRNA deacylase [Kiritimatiellae bacterium]|nr:D-aminoacyl-tRNA deacylase [Kiritimatiellia bacterium]
MRAVVQRVAAAVVSVEDREVARIGAGLLVLVSVAPQDGPDEVAWLARKLPGLRIFADAQGQMNLSVEEIGGGIIVVSQFTLHADCRKGNRPSFIGAAAPAHAEPLYLDLVRQLRDRLGTERVGAGVFGAHMRVSLLNDGPVTLIVETPTTKGPDCPS